MDPLRTFDETHIREDCSQLTGQHVNGLFYGCTFDNLNGLVLKDCVLNGSTFNTATLREALGLTVTLDCFSFRGVELSPLLFDLLLALITMSVGNDEKREQLKDVVGRDRYAALMRVLKITE